MTAPALQSIVDLVAANGMDRAKATLITMYIADRCAGLSMATVHSSSRSSLHRDEYLLEQLALSHQQISAWLALIRGTRAVRQRDGRIAGGCPGMTQVVATGTMDAQQLRRFRRLAKYAAVGRPADLRRPGASRPAYRSLAD